jgi:hypothetical protein
VKEAWIVELEVPLDEPEGATRAKLERALGDRFRDRHVISVRRFWVLPSADEISQSQASAASDSSASDPIPR